MAYTIYRSNSAVLTTIQDGTLNTRTSLGLPGRNYAGYGNVIDTNFARLLENFANDTPPANPIRGQIWFDTTDNKLKVCPADGTTTASDWAVLSATNALGDSNLGNLNVTDTVTANVLTTTRDVLVGHDITVTGNAVVNTNLTATSANIATANISSTITRSITTGGQATTGTLTGSWTIAGSSSGNALNITSGNIAMGTTQSIRCDHYLNTDGTAWVPSGTYTNANVSDFLTGANSTTRFSGAVAVNSVTTANLTTGSSSTAGNITGNWSLTSGSKLIATYSADIAERYAADAIYPVGTVLELGGDFEVTSVKEDASSEVFGVVSNTYAHLLNGAAGTDETHPPVALVGRVPVRVVGQVKKGQRLVSAGNGLARAGKPEELTTFNVIGRSLVNKTDDGEGTIEAAVKIN